MQQSFMILLNTMGIITVEGLDAKSFLQGQVTCQMQNIAPNQTALGAHCNIKGRVESFFRVIENEQSAEYHLLLNHAILDHSLQNFKKYALFSKVTLSEAKSLAVLGLIGTKSATFLDVFFETTQCRALQSDQCFQTIHDNDYFIVIKIAHTNRYQVIASLPGIQRLYDFLKLNVNETDILWESLELEQGYPEIYPSTCGQFLPHHINLISLNAVSFKKGCYLGQEIVNRMQFRGNIKKKLFYAKLHAIKSIIQPGNKLLAPNNERELIGEIVRSVTLANGDTLIQTILSQDIGMGPIETNLGIIEIISDFSYKD